MNLSSLSVTIVLLGIIIPQANGGSVVVVKTDQARLMSATTVVGAAPAGTILKSEMTNTDWVWVTYHGPKGSVKGWISRKDTFPLDEAIKFYTATLRTKPTAAGYAIRGTLWSAKDDYAKAVSDFTEALRRDRKNAKVLSERGFARYQLRDYKRAIDDCSEAIQLDPRLLIAYKVRGMSHAADGQFGEAAADFGMAMQINPKDPSISKLRALSFAANQDWEKAVADYAEVLRMNPDDKDARNWQAEAMKRLNRSE